MKNILKDKRNIVLLVIVAIGLVIIITSISYAFIKYNTKQEEVNVIGTECIKLEMEDLTNGIDLQNARPMTDEAGEATNPYSFKLTNTCDKDITYNINLDILDTENRIDSENIAIIFNDDEKTLLNTYPVTDITYNTAVESHNLYSGTLTSNESVTYHLKLWLDKTAGNETQNGTFFSKIMVTTASFGEKVNLICKRATTLHTTTCNSSCSYDCAGIEGTGNIIRYGNLGTNGNLASGDAFDCDVNGDGIYDAETERFYYVTDNGSETAVLIYYNNVSDGVANNTTLGSQYSSVRDKSPNLAVEQLPSTGQWPNVSLNVTTRDVLDYTGAKVTTAYYSGKAARLLTYQEVLKGCSFSNSPITKGSLRYCNYLLENTEYSGFNETYYWLDTFYNTSDALIIGIFSGLSNSIITNIHGVRPVIEVSKANIQY